MVSTVSVESTANQDILRRTVKIVFGKDVGEEAESKEGAEIEAQVIIKGTNKL